MQAHAEWSNEHLNITHLYKMIIDYPIITSWFQLTQAYAHLAALEMSQMNTFVNTF